MELFTILLFSSRVHGEATVILVHSLHPSPPSSTASPPPDQTADRWPLGDRESTQAEAIRLSHTRIHVDLKIPRSHLTAKVATQNYER